MTRTTSSLLAALLLVVVGGAQAQQMAPMTKSALYGELGYTFLKADGFGTGFRPGAIRGIVGYDFHPNFALEGMLGGGVGHDNKTVAIGGVPTDVQAKLSSMYGIWLKPKYVYNQAELFGRLGWAHTKTEFSPAGMASSSDSHNDFAWGVGANYRFNPTTYVGLDWMRYSNKSDRRVDGLTLSVGYHW